ncbi:MAG: peptide chain release factor N(5)-glutamine methyltransferase [bacterium]
MAGAYQHALGSHLSRSEIMQLFYLLADEYMGWTKTRVHLEPDYLIPIEKLSLFREALVRLLKHEPVEYITGKSMFNGIEYFVNPGVLIPRPETEELCNMIVQDQSADKYKEVAALDIGTGSGCIAIDLKLRLPYARVTAVDNSEDALKTAGQNASRLGAELSLTHLNVLDASAHGKLGRFDIIVSNPPYVTAGERNVMKPNVLDFEPPDAIFVCDDDPFIFYRSIVTLAIHHLNRPGRIYLEINERFGKEIAKILRDSGFDKVEIVRDIFDKDRFVRASLVSRLEDISYWYGE